VVGVALDPKFRLLVYKLPGNKFCTAFSNNFNNILKGEHIEENLLLDSLHADYDHKI
jgi:hypothetical protein